MIDTNKNLKKKSEDLPGHKVENNFFSRIYAKIHFHNFFIKIAYEINKTSRENFTKLRNLCQISNKKTEIVSKKKKNAGFFLHGGSKILPHFCDRKMDLFRFCSFVVGTVLYSSALGSQATSYIEKSCLIYTVQKIKDHYKIYKAVLYNFKIKQKCITR